MAIIYTKLTDKTVVLSPREGAGRKFNFSSWTEVRVGMFFVGVSSSGPNVDNIAESVALSSVSDRISFGIKNSSTTDMPGVAGTKFLGVVTRTGLTSDSQAATAFRSAGGGGLSAAGYNGVTLIGGGAPEEIDPMVFPGASLSTGYNGFYALKFVISNLGGATQAVAISSSPESPVVGTDYSASALRTKINNATYGTPASIAWNSGGVALAIPDAVWVRMPFFNNAIRISAIRAIRYAP